MVYIDLTIGKETMKLSEIMENNRTYLENSDTQKMSARAKKEVVIITCMDSRLINLLEPALGLDKGDANIIKNAGNTLLNKELLRSLVISIYALGTKQILIIGHTNCGMAIFKPEDLYESMRKRGVKKEVIEELELEKWIGTFKDEKENVLDVVNQIKESSLIPDDIKIHGLLIDVDTGALEVLI